MGPTIVAKSFELIFRNLLEAVQATLLPVLVAVAAFVLLLGNPAEIAGTSYLLEGGGATRTRDGVTVQADPAEAFSFLGALLPVIVIALLCFVWAAVAWHRWVLLERRPGWLHVPPGGALLSYAWAAIRVGLISIPIVLVLGIPFGFLAGAVLQLGGGLALVTLMGFGFGLLISYFILRFSLILPAGAIDEPMSLSDSWSITGNAKDAVFVVAVLVAIARTIIDLGGSALASLGWAGVILSFGATWLSALVGLSVLTTLYGHLVERRPL